MKPVIITIVFLLALWGNALAQGDSSAEAAKSHGAAKRLSLFGTLAPMLIGAALTPGSEGNIEEIAVFSLAGMTFGPGLGHSYAGNGRRLLVGAAIRGVAYAAAVGATASSTYTGDATAFAFGGGPALAVALISTIYDIATTGRSVDRYNREHLQAAVSLSPAYLSTLDTPSVILTLQF